MRWKPCLVGASIVFLLCSISCSNLAGGRPKLEAGGQPCAARYVPTGNDPEIALDTQTGSLCRTVADANDPLGILDPGCAVTPDEKKIEFVPKSCLSGRTWVRAEGDKHPEAYRNLPVCAKTIVVTEEDMKAAGAK